MQDTDKFKLLLVTPGWPNQAREALAAMPEHGAFVDLSPEELMKVLKNCGPAGFIRHVLDNEDTKSIAGRLTSQGKLFSTAIVEVGPKDGLSPIARVLKLAAENADIQEERFIAGIFRGLGVNPNVPIDSYGNTVAHLAIECFKNDTTRLQRTITEIQAAAESQNDHSVWATANQYTRFPLDDLLRAFGDNDALLDALPFNFLPNVINRGACCQFYNEQRIYDMSSRGRLGGRLTENNSGWRTDHPNLAIAALGFP